MNILFISLGCDKNLVDSEKMLGLLSANGYVITDDENNADVIVVNTCCFIHDAKEESINTILEVARLKETAKLKVLVVTGCLAERYKEEIRKEIEEVDAVLGTSSYDDIVDTINKALKGENIEIFKDLNYSPDLVKRVMTNSNYRAYLKIAEGCDKRCTYCIIPSIRGKYRSTPMESLIAEAVELANNGVKELILVAQETTVYGKDLYGKKSLHILLEELCKIEGIEWIRILYCYPEEIYDELIETIKKEPKICHYLDMPIQHCNNEILKRMGRRTNYDELVENINKLRREIPDIALRTTLITGFPAETQEQHAELLDFIDQMEFDRLGVFTYSAEEDTKAATFDNQIDEEVKQRRKDELMELQQEISFDKAQEMLGKEIKVLIEGYLYDDDIYVGRSYKDAPNVDGYVFVVAEEELISGDFVNVKIIEAKEYDLVGKVIYKD